MWQRGGSVLGPILNQFCVTSFMNDPLTVLKHFQSATPKKLVQISTIGSANSHPPFTASNFCAEISTLTIFRRTPNCWWCRDVSTPNGALFMPTKSQKCNGHKIDIFNYVSVLMSLHIQTIWNPRDMFMCFLMLALHTELDIARNLIDKN